MNLYNQAFEEALDQNAINENNWKNYKENVNNTRENVNTFLKSCKLDILVPIGKKAFIRGTLQHTNDILVSHSSNYFSLVSNYQANEILDHRNTVCTERLKDLDKERELFRGKLDVPVNDLFPENEIIEEYNEELEKDWWKKHRESNKRFKLQEKAQREAKSDQEINELLDQYELMEEMTSELENLDDEQDYDKLLKLLNGEIKVPETKARKSHKTEKNSEVTAKIPPVESHVIENNIQETKVISTNNIVPEYTEKSEQKKDLIQPKPVNGKMVELIDEKENIEIKKKIKRKVRFSTSLEDVKIIEEPKQEKSAFPPIQIDFNHSSEIFNPDIYKGIDDDVKFKHPGEIFGKILNDINVEYTKKKSILKETNYKFDRHDHISKTHANFNDDEEMFESLSKFPLICGEVIERKPDEDKTVSDVKSKKKVSKFKELRSKVK